MRIQEKPQRFTNCFIIYIIAKIEPISPTYLLYFIGYILEKDLFHVINAKRDFITKEQLNSHKFWGQFLVTISGQLWGLFCNYPNSFFF